MSLWFAALLGLIQGLTEYIPVSSNAHVRVASAIAGQPDAGAAYTAVIQLGTLSPCSCTSRRTSSSCRSR